MRWVVNLTPRPLYPQGKGRVPVGEEVGWDPEPESYYFIKYLPQKRNNVIWNKDVKFYIAFINAQIIQFSLFLLYLSTLSVPEIL
jgi:hypothetical protein